MLTPRKSVPDLLVSTTDGDIWTLSEQTPQHFTLYYEL